jgi:cell division protein ZapA (FtsZ GTPase activity inhibitor)
MGVEVVAEKYAITISGKTFFVGSERGETHVRTVAAYVEQRLQAIASTVRTADAARIALMMAITLAEELLDLSERSHGLG